MSDEVPSVVQSGPQTKFFLFGDVDSEMVSKFAEPFSQAIDEQKLLEKKVLTIYIQGPGGYVDAAQTILGLIHLAQSSGITVRTIALGEVASASSMIAVAGSPKHRYIAPHAEHVLHFGSAYTDGETPVEIERSTKRIKRHFKWIESFYTNRCDIPNLGKHLQYDQYYLTARQCLKYKLADKIIREL